MNARTVHPVFVAVIVTTMLAAFFEACNPFAPEVDTSEKTSPTLLSDQLTTEGVFQNMRYAYTFKDTTIYGGLLHPDFAFSYRDYDKVIDVTWGRDEEMRVTTRLFSAAQSLNLVWNNIIASSGDSLRADITRSFTLTVTFNPSDIIRVDGKASMYLARENTSAPWRIRRWRDESSF